MEVSVEPLATALLPDTRLLGHGGGEPALRDAVVGDDSHAAVGAYEHRGARHGHGRGWGGRRGGVGGEGEIVLVEVEASDDLPARLRLDARQLRRTQGAVRRVVLSAWEGGEAVEVVGALASVQRFIARRKNSSL